MTLHFKTGAGDFSVPIDGVDTTRERGKLMSTRRRTIRHRHRADRTELCCPGGRSGDRGAPPARPHADSWRDGVALSFGGPN